MVKAAISSSLSTGFPFLDPILLLFTTGLSLTAKLLIIVPVVKPGIEKNLCVVLNVNYVILYVMHVISDGTMS